MSTPDGQTEEYVEFESEGTGFTIGKLFLGIVVLASFGVWGYRFTPWADVDPPDLLANETYLQVAEPRCAAALADFNALPNALEAADHVERAAIVQSGTEVLQAMVNDLEVALDAPSVQLNARDDGITREWIVDWRRYLDDRTDFAERFAVDEEAVFFVAASSGGERLERRISRFANTNRLFSCVTPTDIG